MIAWLRARIADVAAGAVAALRGTARHRGDALVLAYHNIVPDKWTPCGDRSLHLPISRFRAQLDALQSDFEIVSLDDALAPGTPDARPRLAITFDDAYCGAVTLGLPELHARGLPATVFVAPGLLGLRTTWWDALAASQMNGAWPMLRAACLATGAGQEAVRALAQSRGASWVEGPPELAIADESVLLAANRAHLTVGAHTWHHLNLRTWQSDWAPQELAAPLEWLRARFGAAARPWLALPFGLDSDAALRAAAEHGYVRQFYVSGGWRRGVATREGFEPRLNVPAEATPARLRFRMGAPSEGLRIAEI